MSDGSRWSGPVDDADAEALLTGRRTDREDLVSLENFLREVRSPERGPVLQPSAELARLFSGGRGIGLSSPPPPDGRRTPPAAGRRPVRRMAKVAIATTTAALAVTLAAAAQVLPKARSTTSVSVSGPATPVQLRAGQDAVTATSAPRVGTGAQVTVPRPTTTAGHPPTTSVRTAGGVDVATLSPEALARLPFDVLKTLSGDTLARLPFDVLRTLPGDALARVPTDVLRGLPGDALARLPLDVMKTLPDDALVRLPPDVLRTLPAEVLARLPIDMLRLLLTQPTTTATTAARP